MRVIDQAHRRLCSGRRGQRTQYGRPYPEQVRRTRKQPERDLKRPLMPRLQFRKSAQHGYAQPVRDG
ncbi:hypothetical protein Acsp02_84540 [Actinoplanes sp. NBRC 103695]|nr:hypothetical protein Acsp02_84540 [Actinoplanes sp. NBRC 103695]